MLLDTFPTREEFRARCAEATVVPVGVRILADTETPVSVLARFAPNHPRLFLLESAEGGERWGRYSFMGVTARATITVFRDDVVVRQGIAEQRTRITMSHSPCCAICSTTSWRTSPACHASVAD